jgi:hypothetical protein
MEIGTSCDHSEIYYPADTTMTSDSQSFDVTAGTVYFVNMKETNTFNRLDYTITFHYDNRPPVARNDSASTNEDTAVTVDVLSNDSDPDGDALSIYSVSGASHGSVSANSNGTITYIPDPDYNGDDHFTYSIHDPSHHTATATVSVTVNPVNDAPVARNDSASTNEDTAVTVDVLSNDSDPDGDALSVTAVSDPSNGNAVIDNNQIIYTPDPDYSGNDSFTYTVSDGTLTATATVTVTVNPVNDAPVALDDTAQTSQETRISIPVLANDSDVDGDTLTITAVTDPAHGSVSINGDTIDYTPEGGFFGTDSFEYTVSDGTLTATATVTVDVARICHGCDCSLDDNSRNSAEPGITIPDLNGTTRSASTCLSGTTSQAEEALGIKNDIYNFTVGIDGEFNITTDSPNDHKFYLEIKINGTIVYPNTKSKNHSFTALLEDGDEVILRFSETGDDLDEYQAHMSFSVPDFTCSHPHQFVTRFNEYIPGDLVAIGNSNICADIDPNDKLNHGDGICDPDQRQRNDLANIIHINKYSSTDSNISSLPDDQAEKLLNVTNAVLDLPPGAKVKWAGLYWHGEVWNFKKGVITNTYGNDSGVDGEKMMAKELKVSFRRPTDGDFMTLKADELYWFNLYRKQLWGRVDGRRVKGKTWGYGYGADFNYTDEHYFYYFNILRYEHHYQGFKDVTALLQEVEAQKGSANGTYWVGNIQATVGLLGFPGVEAAWTLQVVYELPSAQPRVITVTDGYIGLYSSASDGDDYVRDVNATANAGCRLGAENTGVYAYDVSFDIDNILTPQKAGFATDMTVFATESDPDRECADDNLPEQLTLTRKDGSIYVVDGNPASADGAPNRETCDAWHYSLTKKDGTNNLDRHPDALDPIGMTLRNYHMTDALDPDQNSTRITFKTDTDRLIIGVIGFATDLRAPELCYGYDLRIGDFYKVDVDENRSFQVDNLNDEPLQVKLLIRNKEADFDFEHATLYVTFTPDENLTYKTDESEISPEGTFTYLHVDDINSSRGEIPIGKNADSRGGLLDAAEGSTYVKQYFTIADDGFKGTFDINVEGDVTYVQKDGPIHYRLSTANPAGTEGYIPRCPRNPVYDPIYGYFNVEVNGTDPTRDSELRRYSLPTQISGRQFPVQVVHYRKDANNTFKTPAESNTTVEVEIIDVSAFDNNASAGYDVSCEEPSSIGRGAFIEFQNAKTRSFTVGRGGDYDFSGDPDIALRNAAFRVWALTVDHDGNASTERVLLDYHINPGSPNPFKDIYRDHYRNDTLITSACDGNCTSASTTDDECYSCLRTYAGVPFCSRDNFSIRPAYFAEAVHDDGNASAVDAANVSASPVGKNNTASALPLIARYAYPAALAARNYADDGNATHYSRYFGSAYPDRNATLIFSISGGDCADDANLTLDPFIFFESGAIQGGRNYVKLSGPNAGNYRLNLVDTNWTEVDQRAYEHQTKFNGVKHDDCNASNPAYTGPGKPGCWISSGVKDGGSGRGDRYDLNVTFHPDRFSIDGFAFRTRPRGDSTPWLYMSDLDYVPAYTAANGYDMSVEANGTVTARGADDGVLSNYRKDCAAQDTDLLLDYNETLPPAPSIEFQYRLLTRDLAVPAPAVKADRPATLPAALFGENGDANGSASFTFYFNYEKPISAQRINVADINFSVLDVNGSDNDLAWGYGSGSADHRPLGSRDINESRYFYFAQIIAKDSLGVLDPAVPRDETGSTHALNLYVDVFCENNLTAGLDCSSLPGIGSSPVDADPALYRAARGSSWDSARDGKIYLIKRNDTTPSGHASIAPNTNILFNSEASSPQIIVSYLVASTFRDENVTGLVAPDPWLLYDANRSDGRPGFTILFTRELFFWKGEGEMGHVIDIPRAGKNSRTGW